MSCLWWLHWQHMGSLKEEEKREGEHSTMSFYRLDRRGRGVTPHSPKYIFLGDWAIENVKLLCCSPVLTPYHFHWGFMVHVSGSLGWAPEDFLNWSHSTSVTPLQGHKESQERDPQVLLALQGLVALQVARVLQGWGDHQDPMDIAIPLSVLAYPTMDMDKDTKVH